MMIFLLTVMMTVALTMKSIPESRVGIVLANPNMTITTILIGLVRTLLKPCRTVPPRLQQPIHIGAHGKPGI